MHDSNDNIDNGVDPSDVRFGEVLNHYLDRMARGEQVDRAELRARHTEFADELVEAIDLAGDLNPNRYEINDLISRGVLRPPTDQRYQAELGPFKIMEWIGRGGMGVVLKAYEESLDRVVALKVLRPDLAQDKTSLDRFEREAKSTAALSNPHVVTVHAVGTEADTHYISMEYVEGTTLAHHVQRNGPMSLEETTRVFRALLDGLAAAHAAGLIHRDIKPSNILLDDTMRTIKIADFGLARMIDRQTRMTMLDSVFGTPEYMSPEQARGESDIDRRSDLYSSGVVLYEMLTGRTPFKAETPSAVIHKILHDDAPAPNRAHANVDQRLAGLALRLMAKKPDDRLDSAEDALNVLDATVPVPLPEYRRRRVRRAAMIVTAFALIVSCVALVNRITERGTDDQAPNQTVNGPRMTLVDVYPKDESNVSHLATCVRATYEGAPSQDCFIDIGEAGAAANDAVLVKATQGGDAAKIIVAVGVPTNRESLLAFDESKNLLWKTNLTPNITIDWPDLNRPNEVWHARALAVMNTGFDGGPWIVVAANHQSEYPTRISIIEASNGRIFTTFWHLGHIHDLDVMEDFFGEGRSAVVAWGVNNKLDGFGDPPTRPYSPGSGDSEPQSDHDKVPVVMILDPTGMTGIGPPRTDRIRMQPVRPFAYAFLDLASGDESNPEQLAGDLSNTAWISSVNPRHNPVDPDSKTRLEISIKTNVRPEVRRVTMQLDQWLRPCLIETKPHETRITTEDAWRSHWYAMDTDGRFVAGQTCEQDRAMHNKHIAPQVNP